MQSTPLYTEEHGGNMSTVCLLAVFFKTSMLSFSPDRFCLHEKGIFLNCCQYLDCRTIGYIKVILNKWKENGKLGLKTARMSIVEYECYLETGG